MHSSRSFSSVWTRALLQMGAGGLWLALFGPRIYRAEPELFGPVHILLQVAVLIVTPLALVRVATLGSDGEKSFIARTAVLMSPLAGASVAAAFLFPAGRTAAFLAAPWLLFAALVAALGVMRFYRRKGARLRLADLCIDIGLIYLLPAARWLWLSRAGIQPPQVPEFIVALTAIHFHYTFFAATVVTGLLGLRLEVIGSQGVKRLCSLATLGVLAGPMLVATGINTARPGLEVMGAVLLTSSLFTTAILTALVAGPQESRRTPRLVLAAAALALSGAMLLAAYFAIGKYLGLPTLSFQAMIRLHGLANVIYAIGSLLGGYRWCRLGQVEHPDVVFRRSYGEIK